MNGQLREQPLAELIREIYAKGLTGALRLQHEQARAVVYFGAGQVIYATSNLRSHRFSEYLRKHGVVSAEQLTGVKPGASDLAVAAALVANGVLTPEALEAALGHQVAEVLRVALLWTDGAWVFDTRAHLGDPVRVKLSTRSLLLESSRRIGLKFAQSRFADPQETISLAPDVKDMNALSPTEGFVLSRVDGPVRLSELVALSGLREPEALRTIYGLLLCGFLERESWTDFLGEAPTQAPVNEPPTLKASVTHSTEDRGNGELELNNLFERLSEATSHYRTLDVAETAAPEEIKRAYYVLARRFHPDRFHELAHTPLHGRIEAAFARITQAYEVLLDPDSRAAYDLKLNARQKVKSPHDSQRSAQNETKGGVVQSSGRTDSPSDQDLPLAEKRFQEGLAAMEQGQLNLAVTCLSAAARLAPKQAPYRAHYGRALARHGKSHRLAESEIQAAIRLDSANVSYRIMLAELYRELGFIVRAKGELDRVRTLDPENVAAAEMLKTLATMKRR